MTPRAISFTPPSLMIPGISARAFRSMHFGSSKTGQMNAADATLGFNSLKYYSMTPPDPDFDPMKFDFDRDIDRIRETSKMNDGDTTYLVTFASHGKLLMYHGLSDQGLSPLDTAGWYDKLEASTGGTTQDWARLFHGSRHDPLLGRKGNRPVRHARGPPELGRKRPSARPYLAKAGPNTPWPGRTRPLCPYPKIARYTSGDPDSEQSFECRP